jgi:hypothetical protein
LNVSARHPASPDRPVDPVVASCRARLAAHPQVDSCPRPGVRSRRQRSFPLRKIAHPHSRHCPTGTGSVAPWTVPGWNHPGGSAAGALPASRVRWASPEHGSAHHRRRTATTDRSGAARPPRIRPRPRPPRAHRGQRPAPPRPCARLSLPTPSRTRLVSDWCTDGAGCGLHRGSSAG